MFYEVKIFDEKGELKKVISPKRLSNKFWKRDSDAPKDASESEFDPDPFEVKTVLGVPDLTVDDSLY